MNLSWNIFRLLTGLIPSLRFALQDANITEHRHIIAISHRGASTTAPENTLAAIQKAIDAKADMIELDLHLSKDNRLIVIHDSNTRRTTGFDKEIADLDLDEIKTLDAGVWFGHQFAGEKLPTLDEVLEMVNGKADLLIELKWPKDGVYSNFVPIIVDVIQKYKASEWVIIQSFERKYLVEHLKNTGGIRCHQLVYGWSQIFPVYFDRTIRFGYFKHLPGIHSLNIFYKYLNKGFINAMHQKKITVFTFTLNEKDKIAKAINFGVDGIVSDDHELINEVSNFVGN